MKKYKFYPKPIIIKAENEDEAWRLLDEGDWYVECDNMEEVVDEKTNKS